MELRTAGETFMELRTTGETFMDCVLQVGPQAPLLLRL